jgi:hypothetical protein
MNKVKIKEPEGQLIYSPYTGNAPHDMEGEINENDPSLLYVYWGMAGDFGYISDKFREIIDQEIENDIDMWSLDNLLSNEEGILFEVDCGRWNGVNFYGFIDPES